MAQKRKATRTDVTKDTVAATGYLLERMPRGAHTVTAVVNAFESAKPVLSGLYPLIGAATREDVAAAVGKHVKVRGKGTGQHIVLN